MRDKATPSDEGPVCFMRGAFFHFHLHLFALRRGCDAALDCCPALRGLEFAAVVRFLEIPVDRTGPASSVRIVVVVPKDYPFGAAHQTVGVD